MLCETYNTLQLLKKLLNIYITYFSFFILFFFNFLLIIVYFLNLIINKFN